MMRWLQAAGKAICICRDDAQAQRLLVLCRWHHSYVGVLQLDFSVVYSTAFNHLPNTAPGVELDSCKAELAISWIASYTSKSCK